MKVVVTIQGEERDGEKFAFAHPGSLVFGRSEKARCRIEHDPYVSRFHFLLLINPPEVRLRNLSQTNGTLVDGVLYAQGADVDQAAEARTLVKASASDDQAEAILKDGSLIEVGYTRLTVSVEADAYCVECGQAVPRNSESPTERGNLPLCSECRAKRGEAATHRVQRGKEQDSPASRERVAQPPEGKERPPRGYSGSSGGVRHMIRGILRGHRPPGELPSIPGYEIKRKLAEGGMGYILEAVRLADGGRVAMKIIRPDRPVTGEARSRFKREIGITESLDHYNIVTIFDRGEAGGLLWFAMEFIEGGYDLTKHLRASRGRLPCPEAITLILQALEGLTHAHRLNIVHRDLKPSNILLQRSGTRLVPKLTDFGLAKSLENSGLNGSVLTRPAAAMGTIPFMPPEQAMDVRTSQAAADVFSMGATLYHMLTGRLIRDFSPRPNEAIRQVIADSPVPLRQRAPTLPAALTAVVDKALSMDPGNRFPNAEAFRDAIPAATM